MALTGGVIQYGVEAVESDLTKLDSLIKKIGQNLSKNANASGLTHNLKTLIASNRQAATEGKVLTTVFKQQSDVVGEYRNRIRVLDSDVRRNAVSAKEGARQFDLLTKELVEQRQALPVLSKGYADLSVQISRSSSSADRLRGRVNGLSFANQIKGTNQFAASIGELRNAFTGLLAGAGIVQAVRATDAATRSYFDATLAASLYNTELEKMGINSEFGANTSARLATELRTTEDVVQSGAVQLLRYGATLEQTEVLLRSGAASGLAFGRNVSQGIEAIAQAIVGEQSQVLNRIGIAGNLSTAYVQYARDLGVATDELTQQQKVQAALNLILRETQSEIEALDTIFSGYGGAVNNLSVSFTEARREIGENFIPILSTLYNATALVLDLFTNSSPALQRFIIGATGAAAAATTLSIAVAALKLAGVSLFGPAGLLIAGAGIIGGLAAALVGGGGVAFALDQTEEAMDDYASSVSTANTASQELQNATGKDGVAGAIDTLSTLLDEDGQRSLKAYADAHIFPLIAQGKLQEAIELTGRKSSEVLRQTLLDANVGLQSQLNALGRQGSKGLDAQLDVARELDKVESRIAARREAGAPTDRDELRANQLRDQLNDLNREGNLLGLQATALQGTIQDNNALLDELLVNQLKLDNGLITTEEYLENFYGALDLADSKANPYKNTVNGLTNSTDALGEKTRTLQDILGDYETGLKNVNQLYKDNQGSLGALEEQLSLTKTTISDLRDLFEDDKSSGGAFITDAELQTLKVYIDDAVTLETKIKALQDALKEDVFKVQEEATSNYVNTLRLQYENGLLSFEALKEELEFQSDKLKTQLRTALEAGDYTSANSLEVRLNGILQLLTQALTKQRDLIKEGAFDGSSQTNFASDISGENVLKKIEADKKAAEAAAQNRKETLLANIALREQGAALLANVTSSFDYVEQGLLQAEVQKELNRASGEYIDTLAQLNDLALAASQNASRVKQAEEEANAIASLTSQIYSQIDALDRLREKGAEAAKDNAAQAELSRIAANAVSEQASIRNSLALLGLDPKTIKAAADATDLSPLHPRLLEKAQAESARAAQTALALLGLDDRNLAAVAEQVDIAEFQRLIAAKQNTRNTEKSALALLGLDDKSIEAAQQNADGIEALKNVTVEYLNLTNQAPSTTQAYIKVLERLKVEYPNVADSLDELINKTKEFTAAQAELLKQSFSKDFFGIGDNPFQDLLDSQDTERINAANAALADFGLNLNVLSGITNFTNKVDLAVGSLDRLFSTLLENPLDGNNRITALTNFIAEFAGPLSGAVQIIGNAINTILGDLRNGKAEVLKFISETAEANTLLSETFVEAVTVKEERPRVGLAFLFDKTYTAVDKEATALGLSIGNTIANAIADGLTSGDLDLNQVITDLYNDLAVELVILAEPFQEALAEFTKAFQAFLNGEITQEQFDAARAEFFAAYEEAQGQYDKVKIDIPSTDDPNSLNALNEELAALREKLSGLDVDSQEYKDILNDINKLEERIRNAENPVTTTTTTDDFDIGTSFSSTNPAVQFAVALPLINAANSIEGAANRLEVAAGRIDETFSQGLAVDFTANGSSQNVNTRAFRRR